MDGWMDVCIDGCMHVCMQVHLYACMHVCMQVRTYVRTNECMYARMHESVYMWVCVYITYIYICYPPPPEPTFCMISPPKTLFRAVFVVDANYAPIGPDFA